LFVGDFSFIRSCRKHERICLEIDRAYFYCPLGLDIIGYPKGLWIMKIPNNEIFFISIDTISPDSPIHINASILLEGRFVSRLNNIYLLFLNI